MIDVFKVGVSIAFETTGAAILARLANEVLGVHTNVQALNAEIARLGPLLAGAGAVFVGGEILKGLAGMIGASKELNAELNRTQQLGGQFASTVNDARKAAFDTTLQVPTTAPSENVRVLRELATQLQSPQAAIDILPMAEKVAYVVSHFTGEKVEDIVKNLVKVADIRAQIFTKDANGVERVDSAKVMAEFEAAAHGLILAGNYLKSNDMVQMARQSGLPAKAMSEEAFYAALVEMAVSQGSSRTGTSTTSLFSQLVGGTMPVHTAVEMTRMGLMTAAQWHSDHGHIVLDKEATDKFGGALKDPIKWITEVLDPLMQKEGLTDQEKIAEIFKLFGRQTTQRFVGEALSSEPQFARARSMFHDIPNAEDQYRLLQQQDLETNITDFHQAWKGLMESLGDRGVPMAITVLKDLTSAIQTLTSAAEAHPKIAELAIATAAVSASLLTIGGAITVIGFGLPPIVGALRLLVGVTTGAVMLASASTITSIAGALATLVGALLKFGGPVAAFLKLMEPSDTNGGRLPGSDRSEERKQLDRLYPNSPGGRQMTPEGQDAIGMPPVKPAPWHASYQGPPIHIQPVIYMDGHLVTMNVINRMNDWASRPAIGPTGYDPSVTPLHTSHLIPA